MPGKQFRIQLDVDLPDEAFNRIENAIRSAVLGEIVNVDVADEYSVNLRPAAVEAAGTEGGRGTSGIWITSHDRPLRP